MVAPGPYTSWGSGVLVGRSSRLFRFLQSPAHVLACCPTTARPGSKLPPSHEDKVFRVCSKGGVRSVLCVQPAIAARRGGAAGRYVRPRRQLSERPDARGVEVTSLRARTWHTWSW